MSTLKQTTLLIAIFCLISSAYAAPLAPEKLQLLIADYLKEHQAEEHISAIAVSVETANQVKPVSSYAGTESFYKHTPVNAQSLFQIGSITKSFIAAILLQLESDPRFHFNINDPLTQFFPQYPNWQAITIKQLMNMTSGIPDHFSDRGIRSLYFSQPYLEHRPEEWVNLIYSKSLLSAPGTKFNYSNTNYLILGMLIERLTDHTLAYEIEHRIINPLHLQHTYYVTHQPRSNLFPYLVHGYQYENGFAKELPLGTDITGMSLNYLGAAGALISNSEDMTQWIEALFTPDKVLSQSQLQKLTAIISEKTGQPTVHLASSDPNGYGLGIGMQYGANLHSSIYIYQGMTLGYRAIYVYVPKEKLAIAITVNSSYLSKENHLVDLINSIGKELIG